MARALRRDSHDALRCRQQHIAPSHDRSRCRQTSLRGVHDVNVLPHVEQPLRERPQLTALDDSDLSRLRHSQHGCVARLYESDVRADILGGLVLRSNLFLMIGDILILPVLPAGLSGRFLFR